MNDKLSQMGIEHLRGCVSKNCEIKCSDMVDCPLGCLPSCPRCACEKFGEAFAKDIADKLINRMPIRTRREVLETLKAEWGIK